MVVGVCRCLQVFAGVCRWVQVVAGGCRCLQVVAGACRGACRGGCRWLQVVSSGFRGGCRWLQVVSSYCHQLNVCPSDFKWFQVLSAIRCKLFQVVSSFDLCDCLEISYVFNILVFSSLVIFHGLKWLV